MGCCSSQQASSRPTPARHAPAPPNQPIQLQQMHRQEAGSSQGNPERTARLMTPEIRTEFLNATHRAFGAMEYGIIGGGALAEYGHRRGTSDLDVMVSQDLSEVVEAQLLSHGMVRTARGNLIFVLQIPCCPPSTMQWLLSQQRLFNQCHDHLSCSLPRRQNHSELLLRTSAQIRSYVASDGRCYGLDVTTDTALSQTFRGRGDVQRAPQAQAQLMTIGFLLNSKAYSYMTRVGPDMVEKKTNDANDIFFIADYMEKRKIPAKRQESRWLVDYDFWTTFCRDYEAAERIFQALGLQRDATPSPSNRESRRLSMSTRSRTSSGNGSGGFRRR